VIEAHIKHSSKQHFSKGVIEFRIGIEINGEITLKQLKPKDAIEFVVDKAKLKYIVY
jgi:hypothetical protein